MGADREYERQGRRGPGRWLGVAGLVLGIALILIVIMMLAGGGLHHEAPFDHGAGRPADGGASA